MTPKIAPWLIYLLFMPAMLWLSACGTAPAPKSSPTATQPATTATPTPTSSPQVTIDLAALQSYTHPENRFSISYPQNWQYYDRPDGVIFADPNSLASYSVIFTTGDTQYNAQQLKQYLMTYIAQNFAGENSNFQAITQKQQADNSLMAQFSSKDASLGQTVSEVRVIQAGALIFIVQLTTPEAQWPTTQTQLQTLADTFTPLDTHVSPEQQTQETGWALIGPQSKEFGFLYANDWEILEQSQDSVSVSLPEDQMTFTASSFAWPNAIDPKAAENAALAHLEEITGVYTNVQSLPPTEFPLDTATGATIDFVYTGNNDVLMAGSVITALNNGKMYQIIFTAPTDIYEAALQWFNPMVKSFKFLYPTQGLNQDETQDQN